uniref:Uncharacterized protein n=1 Tax=Anguilla anguilla TaxID=7936 RepID=A0A0E9QPS3_ANGAN
MVKVVLVPAVHCYKVYRQGLVLFKVIPSEVQENASEGPEKPGKLAHF